MIDLQEIQKELDNASPLGYKSYKPIYGPSKDKPHENKIKLLSWPPEKGTLAKKVQKHYGLGSDGKRQAICPKTYGHKNVCPICSFIEAATAGGDASLIKRASELGPRERFLQLVINWEEVQQLERGESDKMPQVEIYDSPPKVHRDIMQAMATQKHDFTAYKSALVSLICYNQGVGVAKAVSFTITMEQMVPKIVEIDPKQWLPLVPDLEDASRALSPEKLQALLDGDDDSNSPQESEVKPAAEKEDSIPMQHPTDKKPEPAKEDPKKEEPKPQQAIAAPAAKKKTLADIIAEAQAAKK